MLLWVQEKKQFPGIQFRHKFWIILFVVCKVEENVYGMYVRWCDLNNRSKYRAKQLWHMQWNMHAVVNDFVCVNQQQYLFMRA